MAATVTLQAAGASSGDWTRRRRGIRVGRGGEGCAGDRRQASWLGLGRNGDRRRDAPGRGAALDLGNRDGSQGDVLKYLPSRNFVSSYWARSAQNENLGANSSI
jgi:hypothetical protein